MDIYAFYENVFNLLNTHDNQLIISAVFLGLGALTILLRLAACARFRSMLISFRRNAKEVHAREDIKTLRGGLLRSVAADYIQSAEKNAARIPGAVLIERQLSKASLMGWRYISVMPFTEALESGLPWVGLVLTLSFNEYAFVYGTLTASLFVLHRLFSAFFDFRAARDTLANELLLFMEREIARFYPTDASGAILRLKDELAAAVKKQSDTVAEALRLSAGTPKETAAAPAWDVSVASRGWESALAKAGEVQTQINDAAGKMQAAGDHIQRASDLLAKYLQGYSNALSDQLGTLVSIMESTKETHEAYLKQAQYIERNQQTLETTVASYEASLQSLTQNMGDSLGTFLTLHAQKASQSINDALSRNIEKIANSRDNGAADA